MSSAKDRVGVIAGATGFLGRSLARHYADLGIHLILIGRDEAKLQTLENELTKYSSSKITTVALDFDDDYFPKLFDKTSSFSDRIEFFISTIGSQYPISPTLLCSANDWSKSIQTNLVVPACLAKFFIGKFVENGRGSAILTSGGGAANARANFSAYASAKSGLVRFVETFASELEGLEVRINAIAPGIMPSKMMEEILENSALVGDTEALVAKRTLVEDKWDPKHVLNLCDFLISKESEGITGKLISAEWDNWNEWPQHIKELQESDLYTLRRITGRDRSQDWGDI